MKRSLRLAPRPAPDKLPPLQLRAVQAVLDAWQGTDWLWHGDQEMARLAVEACRTAFAEHREIFDVGTEEHSGVREIRPDIRPDLSPDLSPGMGDGGSAA